MRKSLSISSSGLRIKSGPFAFISCAQVDENETLRDYVDRLSHELMNVDMKVVFRIILIDI